MVSLEDYFNVIKDSRCLKVHPETVERVCRQGALPTAKIHNTWLTTKNALDNFTGTYIPNHGTRKRLI